MHAKWPKYFMNIAKETAKLSKDPSTQVGAVIVNNKRIMSTGFNGAPKPFPDDLVPKDNDDEHLINQKNTYMCHAELNSILNFEGRLSDLAESDLYVTISPCSRCACMIAQLGFRKVVYYEKYHRTEETIAAEHILKTSGVQYISYDEYLKELTVNDNQ